MSAAPRRRVSGARGFFTVEEDSRAGTNRVVHTDQGERSYHIFYQLLAAAAQDRELAGNYYLQGGPTAFDYLSKSGVWEVAGVSDFQDFEKLTDSFEVFGIGEERRHSLYQLLAAVLHLGNLKFKDHQVTSDSSSAAGCKVVNSDTLLLVAALLEVSVQNLEQCLCFTSVRAGPDVILKPNVPEKAVKARDALAKALYEAAFIWLGQHINRTMEEKKAASGPRSTIGILDIFGFEIMQNNSFEQLCINYCNERLQFHFNEECFRIEQEEYRLENVPVESVTYTDNQPCLDLLQKRPGGIFAGIDEEIFTPGGTDEKALQKMYENHLKHEHFARPHPKEGDSRSCFKIVHFAGDVVYKVDGFLEKSSDALHQDIEDLAAASTNAFVRSVMEEKKVQSALSSMPTPNKRRASAAKKKVTLGTQFCKQLNSLMDKLNATNPQFIKCIKPNALKQAKRFHNDEVLDQLRYTGIFGLCKLRQIGFPERMPFEDFFAKYFVLHRRSRDVDQLLRNLAQHGQLQQGAWAKGKSKLFLKSEQYDSLDRELQRALYGIACLLQGQAKVFLARSRLKRIRAVRRQARQLVASREAQQVERALGMLTALPEEGKCWPETREAEHLVVRLKQEAEALLYVRKALESEDESFLERALKICGDLAYGPPEVAAAEHLLGRLRQQKIMTSAIRSAVLSRDLAEVRNCLAQAEALGYGGPELKQLVVLNERLEQEAQASQAYAAAIAARDEAGLEAAVGAMQELGMQIPEGAVSQKERMKVDRARKAKEEALERELQAAIDAGDLAAVAAGLEKALQIGFEHSIVTEGNLVLMASKGKDETVKAAAASVDTIKMKVEARMDFSAIEITQMNGQIATLESIRAELSEPEAKTLAKLKKAAKKANALYDCTQILQAGVTAENYEAISQAIELGTKHNFRPELLAAARARLQSYEPEMDPELATMEAIRELAGNPRWRYDRFSRLRSAQEYTKGAWRASYRKRHQASMLTFVKDVIPTSLTRLKSKSAREGVTCWRSILGFCGVKRKTFPAACAHEVLKKGIAKPVLRDEIFLQLCKFISLNPDPRTAVRGWILLCICIGIFTPTVEFELHLLNFLMYFETDARHVQFARYCLSVLEDELNAEEQELKEGVYRKQLPSTEAIAATLHGDLSFLARSPSPAR